MLRDVTVTYDGYLTRALNRVDLDVRRGEITALLGAKSSAKSTVHRLRCTPDIRSSISGSDPVLNNPPGISAGLRRVRRIRLAVFVSGNACSIR
jgi:ABC-type multidrug transport system ATPase subunit